MLFTLLLFVRTVSFFGEKSCILYSNEQHGPRNSNLHSWNLATPSFNFVSFLGIPFANIRDSLINSLCSTYTNVCMCSKICVCIWNFGKTKKKIFSGIFCMSAFPH